jgi:precorrin-6B methylase 2
MSRKEQFLRIKKEYDEFYREFISQGKLPMGETEAGFWGVSLTDDIFELFKEIRLDKYKSFIDLGSGDGKVALIASLFTNSAGIEFDEDLFKSSVKIRDKLGLDASIVKGDFLKHDLSQYDIIFINPDKQFSEGAEAKLLKEMKGTLIVYNHIYLPNQLKKCKTIWSSNQIPSMIYTISE